MTKPTAAGEFGAGEEAMLSSLCLAALSLSAQHAHRRPAAWNAPRGHRVQTEAEYASYVAHLITFVRTPSPLYADVANASGPMLKEDGTLKGTYTAPAGLTMQPEKALHQLRRAIQSIIDRGIPGDIVETGTWRAGTAVFMVGVVQARPSPAPARWACVKPDLPRACPGVRGAPIRTGAKGHEPTAPLLVLRLFRGLRAQGAAVGAKHAGFIQSEIVGSSWCTYAGASRVHCTMNYARTGASALVGLRRAPRPRDGHV